MTTAKKGITSILLLFLLILLVTSSVLVFVIYKKSAFRQLPTPSASPSISSAQSTLAIVEKIKELNPSISWEDVEREENWNKSDTGYLLTAEIDTTRRVNYEDYFNANGWKKDESLAPTGIEGEVHGYKKVENGKFRFAEVMAKKGAVDQSTPTPVTFQIFVSDLKNSK